MTSKWQIFFKFELPKIHDYVPKVYISENFHFNPFNGGFFPDMWNITVLWLFPDYLVGSAVFFSGMRPSRTCGWIFAVYGSYDVFSPRTVFCGLWQCRNSFGGNIPKTPPNGARIGNFKPNRPNIKNRDILQSIIGLTCNFRRMLGPSNTGRGWSAMTSYQIQHGGWPPFWKSKIRKNSAADRPIFTKFCMST